MSHVMQRMNAVDSMTSLVSLVAQAADQMSPESELSMLDVVLDQMADGVMIADACGDYGASTPPLRACMAAPTNSRR